MRVFITGARGQLGLELTRQLTSLIAHNDLIVTDLHNLDIVNLSQVNEMVQIERPDIIINCAAYTNVDGCETDEATAFRVNAVGARNLSIAACAAGAKIVQLSTDYVFDGNVDTPRREYDPVNPLSCYGKSKAWAEQLVRETNPRHFIVRTAWLYGEGNNFIRTMLRLAGEKSELNVVNDQFGSPTSAVDLAECIGGLIATDHFGTYHATCEGFCSWFEFAVKIFELAGISVKVNPISTEALNRPAPRPKYSVLDNFMLKLIGMNNFRMWEEALEEYLRKEKRIGV